MTDQVNNNIKEHEQSATKATAEENVRELRKEFGENENEDDDDDEVIVPRYKPEDSLAGSTLNSNDNVKKEAPEMSIQLQR